MKALKKINYNVLLLSVIFFLSMIIMTSCGKKEVSELEQGKAIENVDFAEESIEEPIAKSMEKELPPLNLDISFTEENLYITDVGSPENYYHIEEGTLYGYGKNQYGQLGLGTTDDTFHQDWVKIAEDVIHVDYSQNGFLIYITKDNKLYGLGNGLAGTLEQFASYNKDIFYSYSGYEVTKPMLLMENAIYASCGRTDVAALKADGTLWVWGLLWVRSAENFCYQCWPVQVLEEVVYVTGNIYNHAALKKDGTLWTWGYNDSGNCGIEAMPEISTPQKAAEDVTMVWLGSFYKTYHGYPDVTRFDGEYPHDPACTIIQKRDRSYWICGENAGEEQTLPQYYEARDYETTCSFEFIPYEFKYPTNEKGEYVMAYNNLSDYTGYMDRLSVGGYWWLNWDFKNCDFDDDGRWDRVWTETKREEESGNYIGTYFRVEFGNGDIAYIGPFHTVAFNMTGTDLNGDGIKELIFMCQATQSTVPYDSALAIYQKQGNRYVPMNGPLLPGHTFEDYILGFEIDVRSVNGDTVTAGVKGTNLEAGFTTDCDEIIHDTMGDISLGKRYEYCMEQNEYIGSNAWAIDPVEYEGKNALEFRILIQPTPKEDGHDAVVTTIYENGEWIPVAFRIEELREYDYWIDFHGVDTLDALYEGDSIYE